MKTKKDFAEFLIKKNKERITRISFTDAYDIVDDFYKDYEIAFVEKERLKVKLDEIYTMTLNPDEPVPMHVIHCTAAR
jgi:hypothetical protein|tara:strand:+ start:12534 stop:12767 length:234 start_codon:yes stop_codon:yes gene_type:complete